MMSVRILRGGIKIDPPPFATGYKQLNGGRDFVQKVQPSNLPSNTALAVGPWE